LNRPLSPIRHDYKPPAKTGKKNLNAFPWFAAGLGLPLIGLSLFLLLTKSPTDTPTDTAPAVDVSTQIIDDSGIAGAMEDASSNLVHDPIEFAAQDPAEQHFPGFRTPLVLPPEYNVLKLTIRRGDSLDRLFRRYDLSLGDLSKIIALDDAGPHLKKLIPGDELIIEHDEGRLMSLSRELNLTSSMRLFRAGDDFTTEILERPLEVRHGSAYGRIESTLFESAAQAHLTDKTVMNLAGIFAWDIDFVLDIRSGDDFYVLYERLYQDGEYLGDGAIIAAEFNNNGRTIQAIRFIDKEGRSDYFTPDGRSIRKAFLRAPVDFRVSSSFNPNRLHPVLKTVRPHRGTDYAAPHGTPIKASGDGKVIFRGVKSGYGNVVILQHGGNITTLYAHMSRFEPRIRNGTRVRQGQTIGYVGKTGLVTGVHLHYEYRLNGVHRNPRTVKLPQADPIPEEYREEFLATVEPVLDELLQFKRPGISLSVD
jgi:murein DD-endopeptidase MepM/ murein hydrolase activator NlpD